MKIPHFTKCLGSLLTFALLTFSCSQDTETTFAELIVEETIATETITPDEEVTEEAAEPIIDYQKGTLILSEDTKVALDITKGAEENSTSKKTYSLKSITQPKNGKTEMNNNNEIVYSPAADYNGDDSFSYTLDIQDSTETTVEQVNTFNITITPTKDVVDDVIITSYETAKTIAPLTNDTFKASSGVSITEISLANKGIAVLNSDNTITYTPNEATSGEDQIQYKTLVTYNDGVQNTEQGKIIINIEENDNQTNQNVLYWKNLFDAEWIDSDEQIDYLDAEVLSKSKNINQEYYYLGYYVDGLIKIWQATGDNAYLDKALVLINQTISDAVDVGDGYKGWPNADNDGHALWDSFYWRYVATLMRIMHQSPNLRATSNYQKQYDNLLIFTEKNIWDRYESQGLQTFYRVNTHMSSHWARIGMELYIITNKSKYKTVFDNISFGEMYNRESNLRNQFKSNPKTPNAYTWSQTWNANYIQDTSHASAIVSFIVEAYSNNMYWDEKDVNAFDSTLNDVIWKNSNADGFSYKNVDGTGGIDYYGRLHDWLTLGRYSRTLQDKIRDKYTGKHLKFYGIQPIGIAALNEKILTDGAPVYPEIN
ncbi:MULTISPECIES: Ig-like domain-containing protein [Cellulophaga]|uniref:Ig-like domain-containing protein n=1 Tax=Cellulophaga TaxID=104264 RepID=UPI000422A056|nr:MULTISPECIES: Ig-like domain-containing protein [Cellulophaga]AIY13940.1 hypothetical protein M667_12380 [Cellulophaga baltica NN016038]KGK29138.1 hypothetical protein EL45_17975 [Cellulophaga sp. E6(2014)]